MFIFLLSGLFCCLGFSGAIFFAAWAGACFFFLFGQEPRPRPNSKKKKKTRPRPFRACFFLLFEWVVCSFFCCLGGGRVFVFTVWAGGVFFFLLFGRGRVLFLLFGRGRFFFLLFGPGACFFFLLFGRGTGVHSLTRLPGSSLSDPTTKETEQQKKTRVP